MSQSLKRFHVGDRLSEMAIFQNVVYLAGQVPSDTTQGIAGQTRQVLAMVDRLLAEAGTDNAHILMAQIYLADLADYDAMNAVWDDWVPPGDAPHLIFARTPSAWPSKGDAMFRPGAGFEEISEHEERTFALLEIIPRVQPGPLPSDVLSSAEPPPPWRRHSGSDNGFVEQPMTSIASAESAAPGTSAHSSRTTTGSTCCIATSTTRALETRPVTTAGREAFGL
jgi:enamine deaminase RidA (YjgF/YER057c/UK114 family)